MRTFCPAAPGSTSRTQPARNPCRAHNDVRGDRPVRQPRRRPGQHETGQHIGLRAVGFFRFFAGPPPGFTEQAASVVAAGLAAGEDPREAAQAALALHAYEIAFWDALADGLS
jgi:hypothetical protein